MLQLCWFVESIDTDLLENDMDDLRALKISIVEEIRVSMTARLCRDWVNRKSKMSYAIHTKPVFSSLIALCSKFGGANCGIQETRYLDSFPSQRAVAEQKSLSTTVCSFQKFTAGCLNTAC